MKSKTMKLGVAALTVILWIGMVKAQGDQPSAEAQKWNHEIEVKAATQMFNDSSYYAYSVDIFNANRVQIDRRVRGEVKQRGTGNEVKKNVISAGEFKLPEMAEQGLGIKSLTEDLKGSDDVRVHVAFFKDGKNVNPDNFPKEDETARKQMYNLSVQLNKEVVQSELAVAQEVLVKLQADLEKMDRQQEKLSGKKDDRMDKVMDAKKDQVNLEKKLIKEKSKLASLKAKYGSYPSAKELKKLAKAQREVTKREAAIQKKKQEELKQQRKQAKIENADLPDHLKKREELAREIEKQKLLVEDLQQKLEEVR